MNKKMTLLAGAISGVLSGAAMASIDNIIISEYVEGSGDNKAIEILNTGDQDFQFDSTYALFFSDGRYTNEIKSASKGALLDGVTVPAKSTVTFVNIEADDELKAAITTNKGIMVEAHAYESGFYNAMTFNGDDAVFIAKKSDDSDIHDIIGTPGSEWGKDTTLLRTEDSATPSATYDPAAWESSEKDTFTGLGNPELASSYVPPTPCTDAGDTIDVKTVGQVQGEGSFSPLIPEGSFESEESYKVTGIVSAVTAYPASGFYLYDADGNDKTSDGVFVYSKNATDELVGKTVCVVAKAKEYYGLTQLALQDDWEVVDDSVTTVDPVELVRHEDDANFQATLERYEGMLVTTVADMDSKEEGEQAMRVSRSFSFDFDSFRNNMVLAYKRPNPQPNQDHVAGSIDSLAQAAENNDFRLYVESDGKAPNGQIPYYPEFSSAPQDNYVRINDSVTGLTGVIDYSYSNFRLIVPKAIEGEQDITFTHNTPRTDAPELEESNGTDGFTIKVATQNVLNYFNSPFGGSDNNFGDNRGAESQLEFDRQQAKIVEAIYGLDADILGLMEIENNGFGDFSAINELLEAVNAKYYDEDYGDRNNQNSIHNRYVFVGFDQNGDLVLDENDTIGTDAITTGVIYRPSKVSVKAGQIITMPEQHAPMIVDENGSAIVDSKGEVRESGDNYQRHSVAATFNVLNTGKELTVVVNHLKSKGSTCYEDWVGWEEWDNFDPAEDDVRNDDFQGSCENFRVAAAVQLGDELAKIGGDQVVLGDMNSYAYEDPMLVLTENPTGKDIYAAGYTYIGKEAQFGAGGAKITKTYGYINAMELVKEEGETSWSYSYNDEVGSLDHLLLSASLKDRLVDATDWHINAPESSLYDYSNSYKGGNENEANPFYAETPYRSSDHDSALVSLGYKYGEAGESQVNIAVKSGRADIAFPVSADAKAGDIAEIAISPKPVGIALPKVELEDDGAQTVMFDVVGLETGNYTFTMQLVRESASAMSATADSTEVIDSMTMEANISKRDSSNVSPVVPEKDGSGGSFGFGALLGLIGLGFLRRRR